MDRPLGAQISHMLKDRGVKVIFGIPGVHNQEMYRGIEEAGLQHVLARHEQGAGFMADGYARATGRPGVCYVITGPGLCNIMTPMGQAYSDSVPMLVISSCLDETAATRGQLHQMKDQEGAARCVADWSETARTAEAAYGLINRAWMEFHTARPRPKCLQIPIRLLEGAAAPHDPSHMGVSDGVEQPGAELEPVIPHLIGQARRPILILGGGAAEASEPLRSVLARCPIPVFTTYAGRGIVPPDYPYLFGSTLARPSSRQVLAQADLVLAVGTELSEVDLWRDQLGHTARLVRIDIDPAVLADGSGNSMRFKAAAHTVFRSLARASDLPSEFDWNATEVAEARTRWRAEIDAERPGILPVADALRAALPANTMIFSDMTQFAYAAKEIWPMERPGHWHHPSGFGTLGYALPAAIGGKIGVGDQPVIAIAGDYGFQYTLQELMVAAEMNLTLPIILWDNGKLGEIEDSMVRAQIAPNAVVQQNPDFVKLAAAYGAAAARPASVSELQAAVKTALADSGPTLIHVQSDIAL